MVVDDDDDGDDDGLHDTAIRHPRGQHLCIATGVSITLCVGMDVGEKRCFQVPIVQCAQCNECIVPAGGLLFLPAVRNKVSRQ